MIDLDYMRELFKDDPTVRFNEETVDGRNFTIVAYMIATPELWEKEFGRECRGIVFDSDDGECVGTPFEKFFNVGEREETQPHLLNQLIELAIENGEEIRVYNKVDGSMVMPVYTRGGRFYMKSKKSFVSDTAMRANALWASLTLKQPELCEVVAHWDREGYSAIFEYTAPTDKIVIDYGNVERLTLLAVRDRIDGSYATMDEIRADLEFFGVKRSPNFDLVESVKSTEPNVLDAALSWAETVEGVEGWILEIGGKRYKVKTEWYRRKHRCLDLRIRDVAEMVFDDKLDDQRADIETMGVDMAVIDQIEKSVIHQITADIRFVESVAAGARGLEGLDRVNWVKRVACEFEKFVFRTIKSGNVETQVDGIRAVTRRRYLPSFPLTSIGNPNFGGQ